MLYGVEMINLFFNYYRADTEERQEEINACAAYNFHNPYIDRMFVITDCGVREKDKVKVIRCDGAPTFKTVFGLIDNESGEDDVNVVINSDCFLDHEDSHLLSDFPRDEAWCLSRWDVIDGNTKHYNERSSQDCWIFRGKPRRMNLDFSFGQPGCDNRMVYEFCVTGYRSYNPSLDFKIYHLHKSQSRNLFGNGEDREQFRASGIYGFLEASHVHDRSGIWPDFFSHHPRYANT
jgi:hypothetical protein